MPRAASARVQSMASAGPGRLIRSISRSRATTSATERASASDASGARRRMIATSRSSVRVVDPVVEAPALEGVVQLAGAVGGQHHDRRLLGRDRADLRDRHRGVGEHLEQEGLELLVGPVQLVHQQHRPGSRAHRAQQRPLDQELRAVELGGAAARGRAGRPGSSGRRGAGASSPTRTAPGRRRCPRSTGAGSARRPARAPASARSRSCPRPARPPAAAAGGA